MPVGPGKISLIKVPMGSRMPPLLVVVGSDEEVSFTMPVGAMTMPDSVSVSVERVLDLLSDLEEPEVG